MLAARKAEEAQRGREAQRAEGARRCARELAERARREEVRCAVPIREAAATSAFAKAGIGLLSTALTLPVGTVPGRYTVEHRIETENGRNSARSQFSIVSR